MSRRYPIALDLDGRRVLVVGGGPVAARRARSLVDSGARVDVVTPWACETLWELADAGKLRINLREYEHEDVNGAWLVHTATGDRSVDAAVADAAAAARIWCIRADDAKRSNAWAPAVAATDDVVIAVTGADPMRSMAIRDAIRDQLESGALPVRRLRTPRPGNGWVALVGGGPGDPGLITARGLQLLAAADVVVADRLGPRDLLERLASDVEVIDASKGRDAHLMTQDEINAVIVERAAAGLRVVRLKGGDPFVLGRGGEEVLACADAGIAVEVVPGVTSSIAAPALAGIPVTHRGSSAQFTVISAHDEPEAVAARAPREGTLVVLMGVQKLAGLARALVALGRDADTAVAVVESGTLPQQRRTSGTLATIADEAARVGVRSPAVIVIGEVSALADRIGSALTRVTT